MSQSLAAVDWLTAAIIAARWVRSLQVVVAMGLVVAWMLLTIQRYVWDGGTAGQLRYAPNSLVRDVRSRGPPIPLSFLVLTYLPHGILVTILLALTVALTRLLVAEGPTCSSRSAP